MSRPVRVTVELQGPEHRSLYDLCGALAEELDRPRVAGAEVLRALLAELLDDPDLRDRITNRLQPTRGRAL